MALLITGPLSAGHTQAALDAFRSTPGARLVVPSATLAGHLRHELARQGFPVRPRAILTLGQLLEEATPLGPVPAPLLTALVEQQLEASAPARFAAVRDLPGFQRALADLLEELPFWPIPKELAPLLDRVEKELRPRGLARRNVRIEFATMTPRAAGPLIIDGFFTFSRAEVRWLIALAGLAPLTLTLPDGPSSGEARHQFLKAGFEHRELVASTAVPVPEVFSATGVERECEEIARRILEEAANGRPWREIGIVLRAREPYASLLQTTLTRFGIPARFYFADPLAAHPAAQFLLRIMRALFAGGDGEQLLAALRMPVSGIGTTAAGDALDFEWRDMLPGSPAAALDLLTPFRDWTRAALTPEEWSERLRELLRLLPLPQVDDGVSRVQFEAWRSWAAFIQKFPDVVAAAMTALPAGKRIGLEAAWKQVERVLFLEPQRVADQRRDVVHVMDVFEARQWSLPVVFVCGLVERHFPQYHREDPLLGEQERKMLGMETAQERQEAEPFLFEIARTRATARTVLSYPSLDEKGEETLRSFFLDTYPEQPVTGVVAPKPVLRIGLPSDARPTGIRHNKLSASAIDSFLQCPFQFYGRRTLRLKPRPDAPRDRLNVMVQGSILHAALAEWQATPLLGRQVLLDIFEQECRKKRIQATYRTEAVRLELQRHFVAFIGTGQLELQGWRSREEAEFDVALSDDLRIRGRIDRMLESPAHEALVIDYKYSAPGKMKDHVAGSESGNKVQAGLYLLAAREQFGLTPAGMLFCGLKGGVQWEGWHTSISGLERAGTSVLPAEIETLLEQARRTALDVQGQMQAGRMEPEPADTSKCRYCEYVDICRVESVESAQVKGAGE